MKTFSTATDYARQSLIVEIWGTNMVSSNVFEKAKSRLDFTFPYSYDEWKSLNYVMENQHKHTEWSNLVQPDSATSAENFIDKSLKMGRKLYFTGEHGFQGHHFFCYDLCKSKNIGFRYSTEMYWVKDRAVELKDRTNCHIVLVARNYNASRKLNYLISLAHDEGYYGKPRIDLNDLFTLSPDDVYVMSACVAGWKYEGATEIWLRVWNHFKDSFFLEYQIHNTDKQKELNRKIWEISKATGIKTIIGLDTHYLDEEDSIKRDNIIRDSGIHYEDEVGWYMDDPDGCEVIRRMREQGVLSDEEIVYSMMNTHTFLNGCEEIEYDTKFKIPIRPDLEHLTYEERANVLKEFLIEKFNEEDEEHKTKDRYDGMMYEFGEVDGSGTVDYFLDNAEIVHHAIEDLDGKLTTTSRGSASSYYISKLCGFTTMDRFDAEVPIYPERFITKERILEASSMPDIDFNISKAEPFVQSARDIFGEHSCYPLLAVEKLGEKSGFKMYARLEDVEPSIATDVSKAIDKFNDAKKHAEDDEKDNIFIEDYITDKELLKIFNASKPYQNIKKKSKVHACGYILFNGNPRQKNVVGYGDVRYEIGLIRSVSESTGTSTIVANIEGGYLDRFGYVKDDFLIVDVVSIISKLYEAIGMKVPTVSELRKMVENDKPTWELYEKGATCCLNQCEKSATTKRVMRYKPQNIKELAAFIAAIRPGFKSLLDGFLDRIPYSNGEEAIDNLLSKCFNYMLYQEAVMGVFSWLGIPMKDAYDTIKKISKKKLKGEALKKVENGLRTHWLENVGNLDNFDAVYKVVKDSARYSFNAPHALAMACDSLYEAWMKAHHTSIFYEVTLNHYQGKGDKEKVADLIKEAREFFGYKMGSYEYGKDNSKFTVDDNEKIIYPSLSSVKGIGEQAVQSIYGISQNVLSDSIIDVYLAIKGTKINATVFRNLVKIGYFHKFGSRKQILAQLDLIDYWKGSSGTGRKKIKKSDIENNINPVFNFDVRKYATDVLPTGNVSEKEYTITNWLGLVKEVCSHVSDEEFSQLELVSKEFQVLGYTETICPELSNRYILITDLDTKYSPKFNAFCLKNGQTMVHKIHKKPNKRSGIATAFSNCPVKNGDIIFVKKWDKKELNKKVGDDWIPTGQFDWWVEDYVVSYSEEVAE